MSDTTMKNLQSRAVYFDDVSTVDLGIYLKSVDFSPPTVKTENTEVPGMNGNYDYTEVLTGYPTFQNRTIKITFFDPQPVRAMYQRFSRLCNLLHGKKFNKIIFANDKGYYWTGRVNVDGYSYGDGIMEYTVSIDAYPYKRSVQTSNEPWEWDTFSFFTGYIGNSGEGFISAFQGDIEFTVASQEPCEFEVINSGSTACELSFNGAAFVTCQPGKTHFTQLLKPGVNRAESKGGFNISVDWREGYL